MYLLMTLLGLVAVPHLCIGNEEADAILALSTNLPAVQDAIIHKNNELRRTVDPKASNMLKMEWSDEIRKNCEKVANSCIYQHSNQNERQSKNGMKWGENLFFSSSPVSWDEVHQAWYDEKNDFNFGVGPKYTGAKVGHYTQVVWFKSRLVGCAVAKCPLEDLPYFYVCQYGPGGNVQPNQYTPYKIGKPCGDCPNNCDAGLCTNPCKADPNKYSNCDALKKDYSCEHEFVKTNCPESCGCTTEIR